MCFLLMLGACRGRTAPERGPRLDATVAVNPTAPAADTGAALARSPDAAPAVAEGCVRVPEALETVGRNAIVTSLSLRAVTAPEPAALLAWAVPPLRAHGGDDLALARLSGDLRSVTMLDPEEPSDARGLGRSPLSVFHAFVRVRGGSPPAYSVDSDRLSRDEDGNEFVECGDLTGQVSAVDPGSDDTVPRRLLPRALTYCRTASQVERPFVLGLTLVGPPDAPTGLGFFATRSRTGPSGALPWRLPVDTAELRRARAPAAFLRDHTPEGLEVAELPGSGYALAFRHEGRLHLGYLDPSLRALGPLHPVPTLGGEPGRPRLAVDGQGLLLVVADRPQGDAGSAPYTLFASRLAWATPPVALTPLAASLPLVPAPGHLFAPWAAPLEDGGWAVAFSAGALQLRAEGDRQQVWLQRFAPALQPRGAPLLVADDASDPRAVVVPSGPAPTLLLAMASGRSQHRAVLLRAYRCPSP
ncbi:MAG: hypothetical protein HY909_22590 [Deltaproteobacteria bacterium]|nr:hypothetical protein [Deltaproteobacteria bacterium]